MQRAHTLAALALALSILAPSASLCGDRFKATLVLDGRLVATPESKGFLDGGLGKTRYGHDPRVIEAKLAQAALLAQFEARPDLTLRVQGNFDAEHNFERRLDLVEAVLRYNPAVGDTATFDIRAGLLFPTVSLENTDPGWLSPYATTFSAINAWIGEEVRNVGVEAGPSFRLGEAQLRVFGAYTTGNDPNGTLLAWRGFALHDRISGYGDRLPLPRLKSFDRPDLFPEQPLHVQPLREVDQKWTWSSGLTLSHPRYRVKALYQPKTADAASFDGQQYAWRTGYWAVGASRFFGPVELLVQGLDGETRMGRLPSGRNAVAAHFRAGYAMASWAAAADTRHRLTVRYDAFRVEDRDDFVVQDANDESGSAWTFAYALTPVRRLRFTAEFVRVDSTRTNRRDLGLPARELDLMGTLACRLTF